MKTGGWIQWIVENACDQSPYLWKKKKKWMQTLRMTHNHQPSYVLWRFILTWNLLVMKYGAKCNQCPCNMPNRANKLIPTVSDSQYLVNVGKFLYQTDMSVIFFFWCLLARSFVLVAPMGRRSSDYIQSKQILCTANRKGIHNKYLPRCESINFCINTLRSVSLVFLFVRYFNLFAFIANTNFISKEMFSTVLLKWKWWQTKLHWNGRSKWTQMSNWSIKAQLRAIRLHMTCTYQIATWTLNTDDKFNWIFLPPLIQIDFHQTKWTNLCRILI